MLNTRVCAIEAWFAEHDGDGEFQCGGRAVPYSVMGPSDGTSWIVLTTKPAFVSAAVETAPAPVEFGMVGRYGLPIAADVPWISDLVGSRRIAFLGDMDPVDLMVFSWFRECLPRAQITYLGLGDKLLHELAIPVEDSLSAPFSPSEQSALSVTREVCPEFRGILGSNCSGMLEQARKIEVEALLIAIGRVASAMQSVFRGLEPENSSR